MYAGNKRAYEFGEYRVHTRDNRGDNLGTIVFIVRDFSPLTEFSTARSSSVDNYEALSEL